MTVRALINALERVANKRQRVELIDEGPRMGFRGVAEVREEDGRVVLDGETKKNQEERLAAIQKANREGRSWS
jgi:hypothetical protein